METGTVSQKQQLNQTVKLKKKLIITMMMISIDWRFLCQFRSSILIEKRW